MGAEAPQIEVTSRAQWRAWLEEHHASASGAWVVTYKKAGGHLHVPYGDIVEEALCFGWVDSKGRGLDDRRSQLYCTRRRPGSGWSRPNKERIERLEAAGLVAPAGRAVIDAAKADGSWTLLDAVEALEEPADLARALDATPGAREHWDAFPRSARRAMLEWLVTAKRDETRARRIAEIAAKAGQGVRARP